MKGDDNLNMIIFWIIGAIIYLIDAAIVFLCLHKRGDRVATTINKLAISLSWIITMTIYALVAFISGGFKELMREIKEKK